MRPVSHDVGVNGGRELREFVDEHNDEALEMRLFVRFDTAGGVHLNEVRKSRSRATSSDCTALANGVFLP